MKLYLQTILDFIKSNKSFLFCIFLHFEYLYHDKAEATYIFKHPIYFYIPTLN